MALTATKTTTGYIVEGKDSAGKAVEIFYDQWSAENYDRLVEAEQMFHKNEEFNAKREALRANDPERQLYLEVFGTDSAPTDPALHSTLVEPVEARDGIAIDWSQNPVTAVLRLIDQGQSHRLRLIGGALVDLGPSAKKPAAKKAPAKKAATKS